jgi:hypothetical protein
MAGARHHGLVVIGALAAAVLSARASRADDTSEALEELKRGYALKQTGDCAQAVPHFQRSLQLSSTAKGLLNLSDCEARLGNLAAAREHAAAGRTLAGLQSDAELVAVADRQLAVIDRAQSATSPSPSPLPSTGVPPPDERAPEPSVPPSPPSPPAGSARPPVAWIALGLGVGVVGLAVGAGAGVAAGSKHEALVRDCAPDGVCPPAERGALDDFHTLTTWSTVGYVVGAAGFIGAGIVWLVRPRPSHTGATAHAWVGLGSAGVAGSF